MILAQAIGGYSLGQIAIWLVIALAICGIVYAAAQYFEVTIPPILVKLVGIVIVAALAILAIRFLLSL
jgi:hypothetical protein